MGCAFVSPQSDFSHLPLLVPVFYPITIFWIVGTSSSCKEGISIAILHYTFANAYFDVLISFSFISSRNLLLCSILLNRVTFGWHKAYSILSMVGCPLQVYYLQGLHPLITHFFLSHPYFVFSFNRSSSQLHTTTSTKFTLIKHISFASSAVFLAYWIMWLAYYYLGVYFFTYIATNHGKASSNG